MENFSRNSSEEELIVPDRNARLDVQARFFDVHPELITPHHLNNLYTKLFGAAYRQQMEGYENIMKKVGADTQGYQSQKRNGQSLEQFYVVVDEATQEAGVSLEDSARLGEELQMARKQSDYERTEKILNEILEKCLAIYRVLREKGYNHYDIVQ
jgi:hypothetical protein